MKKLINRFLGVVVAAALLMGSVMPNVAVMADDHTHGGGNSLNSGHENVKNTGDYTITLKHPDKSNKFDSYKSHYGAYQIFSGVVTNVKQTDDNTANAKYPITDIKWGSAFNDKTDEQTKKNILEFVYALYNAPDGDYAYAFSDFDGFKDFFDGDNLQSKYITDKSTISVSLKDVTGDVDKVNFNKLAVDVADVLADKINDHEWLQAFNDILGGYVSGGATASDYANDAYAKSYYEGFVSSDTEYKIYVPAGYYMIRDLSTINDSSSVDQDKSYSARMLFVANDITQNLKEAVPKLDKEILRDGTAVGGNGNETDVAGVGDVVHFQLEGTLPSNYDLYLGGYQYTFIDTLSKGLNLSTKDGELYDTGSADGFVNVKVKGLFKTEDAGSVWTWDPDVEKSIPIKYIDYTKAVGEEGHTHHLTDGTVPDDGDSNNNFEPSYDKTKRTLTVKFTCLKEIIIQDADDTDTYYRLGYNTKEAEKSSEIYVDYYAKVNKDAVVTPGVGNENEAQIQYSDNPQAYGDTDYTTVDKARVYTFGLDIVKIDAASFLENDGDDAKSALADADFAIIRETTSGSYEIAKVSENSDGSYSIEEWIDMGTPTSDSTADLQALVDRYNIDDTMHVTSNTAGKINISGLDAGVTYTMVETKTPGGDGEYAKINPFTINLTAAKDTAGKEYTGTLESATVNPDVKAGESFSYTNYVQLTDPAAEYPNTDGSAKMLVANFKYVDLPSTGGIGIYPFYIIGGIVVAGSIILFALSRRKKTA